MAGARHAYRDVPGIGANVVASDSVSHVDHIGRHANTLTLAEPLADAAEPVTHAATAATRDADDAGGAG